MAELKLLLETVLSKLWIVRQDLDNESISSQDLTEMIFLVQSAISQIEAKNNTDNALGVIMKAMRIGRIIQKIYLDS